MQMARRPQQSSRPSQSTTDALTRLATEGNRSSERVESWRDEKRSDDLSGAMSRMRVSARHLAASRPRPRPRSPLPETPSPPRRRERKVPCRPAPHQRAPSLSPSPPLVRRRASPLNDPFDEAFGVRQRTRNPMDIGDDPPTSSGARRSPTNNTGNYSCSITTTSYSSGGTTSSRNQYTVNGQRVRDTYRSTRHQRGMQHDPGCPFCFETQGARRGCADRG